MAKKITGGLGKGLSSLLDGDLDTFAGQGGVTKVKIHRLEPNKDQPRRGFDAQPLDELAQSIAQHGVITPLIVRSLGDDRYQIIAGERRWRASKLAGLDEVPVITVEADDRLASEISLVENLQREDLSPVEEAAGIRRYMNEFSLTQEAVAERLGKSRPAVANLLRILSLPPEVLDMVSAGVLSFGHARALLGLTGAASIIAAAKTVASKSLNVRQTETLVKALSAGEKKPPEQNAEPDYSADVSKRLSASMGRKVNLRVSRGKGRIELEFYDMDDLDRLIALLEQSGSAARGSD